MNSKQNKKVIWKQNASDQFRIWKEDDKICNFTYTPHTVHMPVDLIETGESNRSKPIPLDSDPWKRYFIPNLGIANHSHGYYHSRLNKDFTDILIVAKGVMGVKCDSGKFTVHKNEMLIIPSDNLCDTFITSVNTTLYWIHLADNSFWKTRIGDNIRIEKFRHIPQLISLMDAYKCEVYNEDRSLHILNLISQSVGETILAMFKTNIKNSFSIANIFAKIEKSPELKWETCLEARKLGVSQPTLNAKCRELFGMTFHEKLTDIRMAKAKELIADGMSTELVAKAVGFAGAYSLAKAFHKTFGVYPKAVRKIQ